MSSINNMMIDKDAIYHIYRHATAEEKAQLLNTLSQGPSDAVVNDTNYIICMPPILLTLI